MFAGTCRACFLAAALLAAPIAGVRQIAVSGTDETVSAVSHSLASEQSSDNTTFSLEGTVVNSVTGEPIRNALVQTYFMQQISTLSGPDGKFKFEGLPPGQTVITVRKPGFFTEEDLRPTTRRQISVVTGPNSVPVLLKLVPEGVIYGRITGDDGEGIEGLPVQLLAEKLREGRKVMDQQAGASTDEDGAFRIAELLPGSYFLQVGPSATPASFRNNESQKTAQGYPVAFYPAAADISAAAPILISPGKHTELNFAVPLQPFHRVSGNVAGYTAGQPVTVRFFNVLGEATAVNSRFDPSKGTFEARWVPTGSYTIRAQGRDGQGRVLTASVPVNVNSEMAGVHVMLLPATTIPVRAKLVTARAGSVRSVGSQQQQPLAFVSLVSRDAAQSKMQTQTVLWGDGETGFGEIQSVVPGTYSVKIVPSGAAYVQSAVSGSLNLLEKDLTVAAGEAVPTIEIVLRDDVAALSGRVSSDGQPTRGVVIAIPRQATNEIRIQPANDDGTFQIELLAPGEYTILAVDNADNLEYANPEVSRKYLANAKEITLTGEQRGKIDLELIKVAEAGQ